MSASKFDPPIDSTEVVAALPAYQTATHVFVGGQATVFRATSKDGSAHAVKIYFPDPDAYVDERTDREVGALRRLQSDTLVKLEHDGRCDLRGASCRYVATSFIDGDSVNTRLKTGPLDLAAVARVGVDVASAIALLWTERIVHRDVTPNNIMLTPAGRAVLIDLGLARHTQLASLTKPNEGWGTMGYLSPEQFAATRSLTCKSDVFSLGLVLQQSLLGVHPYARDQRRIVRGRVPTISLRAGLPADACNVIDQMLDLNPAFRPAPTTVGTRLGAFAR